MSWDSHRTDDVTVYGFSWVDNCVVLLGGLIVVVASIATPAVMP